MTQALPRPSSLPSTLQLDVQITSMHPVEASDTATAFLRGGGQEQIASNTLLLYPGEASEILVRVQNMSDRPACFSVSLETDLPTDTRFASRIDVEPTSVHPQQTLPGKQIEEFAIVIIAPGDFFEQKEALSEEHPRLDLSYQLRVYVFQDERLQETREANIDQHDRPAGYAFFEIYIRPRTTYLDFLPPFYREHDFIGRFLAIFEQTFDPYVQTLDALCAYLDPLTAPESLLPFLAYWVAWKIEPNWDLDQQRRMIRHALELYRWHGTRHGLRLYLHLYTGLPFDEEHIGIEETFGGGFTFGSCRFGEDTMIGGGRPYHYVVRLRTPPDYLHSLDLNLIRSVIEREKPPFCTYDLDVNPLNADISSQAAAEPS